jgi:hypothetical protein
MHADVPSAGASPHGPPGLRRYPRAFAARLASVLGTALLLLGTQTVLLHAEPEANALAATGDITGAVTDSASGRPLATAQVNVAQHGQVLTSATADAFGHYTIHGLAAGDYTVSVSVIGFSPVSRHVHLAASADAVRVDFRMVSAPVTLQAVEVVGQAPVAVDTRTGDETFKIDQYHGAPVNTTSQIVQQSIAGAARAPTGEVHIRGQHAEYTYYVDGVPVPSGISGSLNELFDPTVTNNIDFKTGGWDAEYGGKMAAVIDVTTKIPAGGFHMDVNSYGGSYAANGQSFSASTNSGKVGLFLSGARQVTDMRTEPVMGDTLTSSPLNFHNHGEDLFGFAKMQYASGTADLLNLDANWSRTRFQVPYDSTGGAFLNDNQQDVNGFVNGAWHHQFGGGGGAEAEAPAELFVGGFYRHGSLTYTPGAGDVAQFIFYPDTLTPYNLTEDRTFNTYGTKLDLTLRPQHGLMFKTGVLGSYTRGQEDFVTTAQDGTAGPASNSDLKGWDFGAYAEGSISPSDIVEIRPGVRFDAHNAPFAGTLTQVSPRIRLNFYPAPGTTLYAYYGRLFMPTNVEDLRAITSTAQGGVATTPTLPERDHFFEVGLVRRFPVGVVAKLSGYYKRSSPGIDDNTVPGSAIVTSDNIELVRVTGIETAVEIRPGGPLSGYMNLALSHAYGFGTLTGGFFPSEPPGGAFDLDHDQRLSGLASLTYSQGPVALTASGTYGSGLTNGEDPDSTYSTSLFAFNKSIKVAPSFIINASGGYTMNAGPTAVRLSVYVENVLDHHYLLKGAFFSGASFGRPRTIQLRAKLGV